MKEVLEYLNTLKELASEPVYKKWDFWLSQFFALVGFVLSFLAYQEAKKAKLAAETAAKTVKSLTVAMELIEIAQKLDRLDENIQYPICRDFLNENSRKIRRLISPFRDDADVGETVIKVEETLSLIRASLDSVRPFGERNVGAANAVYMAVEAPFAILTGLVGELIGNFERRSIQSNG